MLQDLYQLEQYYGALGAIQFLDELTEKYKPSKITQALKAGDLETKCVHCGPSKGKLMVWLSQQGKSKAMAL